jgi:hypothetical protein
VDIAFIVARDALSAFPVVLWLGSVAWVWSDAARRGPARRARGFTVAALLLPFVGAVFYAAVRDEDPLDRRERAVTRRLLEAALEPPDRCLDCRTPLQPDFRCCPGCGLELRKPCRGCGEPLRLGWNVCPLCLEPAVADPHSLRAVA